MNLLMILYFAFISPPIQSAEKPTNELFLTSEKLVKPTKKPVEESSVYYYAPTEWVKISKKI
jgi:hypothetical protein